MSTRVNYFEIIGITSDNEVIMLDSIFDHGKGFKGATGSRFYALTQGEIDDRNDLENIKDSYGYLWQESVKDGNTEESLDDFIQGLIDSSDGAFLGHDDSYIHHIPESFRAEHFPDAVTFECVGGGRMFDCPDKTDWRVLLRPDLLKLIEESERPKLKLA